MYQGLIHSHSGLRWILLLILISAVINGLSKRGKAGYTKTDKNLYLFTLIFAHIQLVLGIALYFMSTKVMFEGGVMGSTVHRFFTVEHTLGMLIAIILITFGYRAFKAAPEATKHRSVSTLYLIALILILISIPWPFREGLGAGWF